MARESFVRCDRCSNLENIDKASVVVLNPDVDSNKTLDLCERCFKALASWLVRDNATVQGDFNRPEGLRGPGWREVCSHNIPCGGSCPAPRYERVT